jgi:hypothetical protein
MTDEKKELVLKDLTDTPVLPVLTEGALAGCFLVNAVDVSGAKYKNTSRRHIQEAQRVRGKV